MSPSPAASPAGDLPIDLLITLDRAHGIQELLRGIAHDLRNSLQVLTLGGALADGGLEPRMELAIDEMSDLLQVLGQFGHRAEPETARAATLPTLRLVERLSGFQRNVPQVPVTFDCPADLPAVAIDQAALVQVLLNLLLNAREASGRGDRVALTARAVAGDAMVEITVSGGAAAAREPAWSPGVVRLVAARALAERAGGTLALDSGTAGARATLRLPAG
jgi:signal transduction histidine kinase